MSSEQFVHLHCHTEFSMLDGAARIKELFSAAQEMGMPALAITDHGNMFGAYEFYKASKNFDVKPIIGIEAYLTPKTHRSERKRVQFGDGTGEDIAARGAYTHMTMWAENPSGMHNLFRLSSRSSLEGFYQKPRADRELLNLYSPGIMATTGCPSGEVQTYLRLGQYKDALASAAEFKDIFGADNFFVELMDHGLDIENRVRQDLLRIAKELHLKLVATNDLHYTHKEDSQAHDVLLCISTGARKSDVERFRFDGDTYYLRSPQEMRELFKELPQACNTTLEIAERVETKFDEGIGTYMPKYDCPEGETEDSWFIKEVESGLHKRYPSGITDEIRQRAEFEKNIILQMGFSGYFLVVADFIGWSKRNEIRVGPGRGSGAGSICAYAMQITDLDPIQHGLLFERFLNPERVSMPDFDIDFDERRRAEVITYVTEKYGASNVAQIITYGSIKAKQAVKDASRVLDKPYSLGEKITKSMPEPLMGKTVPLKKLFDSDDSRYADGKEFRELYQSEPEVKQVVDTAIGIENLNRQWGVHAAGVIMSWKPLLDVVPIMKRETDGAVITQFSYPGCEALGLIKMDFLGLRNLTVLDDAVRNVKLNRGLDIIPEELPMGDKNTFDLLQNGDTLGVFQLDGGPMRTLLRSMKPDKFADISASLALYRPGPMGADSHNKYARRKTGKEDIEPIHPELAEPLEDILGETYGLIVYQEQVMAIAQKLAGYTLGQADLLRRAMGKKKKEILDKEFGPFSQGMSERGYSQECIKALWDILVPFSDYAFNKAHTAAYGMISYWTAYFKANYAPEYMAALLQSTRDDKDKSAVYLGECRRMGIQILSPDINESQQAFTPVGNDIRFGLAALRNVGDHVVDLWIKEREKVGKVTSFNDFLDKAPLQICNKRVVESLIKSGAFDSLEHTRRSLMEIFESAIDQVVDLKRNAENGQDDLFGMASEETEEAQHIEIPDIKEWEKSTKLAFEREMLGLYVSDHPLNGLEHVLKKNRDYSISALWEPDGPKGTNIKLCGLVTHIERKTTRNGKYWAKITVEDLEASIQILVFPKVYEQISLQLVTDTVISIKGAIVVDDGVVTMRAQEITIPKITSNTQQGPITLVLQAQRCTPELISRLKEILTEYNGTSDVILQLKDAQKTTVYKLSDIYSVKVSSALVAELKALLGPSCLEW